MGRARRVWGGKEQLLAACLRELWEQLLTFMSLVSGYSKRNREQKSVKGNVVMYMTDVGDRVLLLCQLNL